jgi:hypothetical protein
MITVDFRRRFRAVVRRLYCLYNLQFFLTQRPVVITQNEFTQVRIFFPLPFTALPTLDLIVYQ